jgi:hypothetical protein
MAEVTGVAVEVNSSSYLVNAGIGGLYSTTYMYSGAQFDNNNRAKSSKSRFFQGQVLPRASSSKGKFFQGIGGFR